MSIHPDFHADIGTLSRELARDGSCPRTVGVNIMDSSKAIDWKELIVKLEKAPQ